MTDERTERSTEDEVLWEMSRQSQGAALGSPTDEELAAYRRGDLGEEAASSLEVKLASSEVARERLARGGGVALDEPPPGVRERVFRDLDAAVRPLRRSASEEAPSRSTWRLAAAVAVALLAVALVWLLRAEPELPPGGDSTVVASLDAFDVEVHGLASSRGGEGALAEAYPDTRVRISVSDRLAVSTPFEVGLYRRESGDLVRVHRSVQAESYQGATELSVLARELAGTGTEGTVSFLVVVAVPGDLPDRLDAQDADRGRGVFERSLNLLADG